MTPEQAKQNLLNLLGHPDMKLCWDDHVGLRQSIDLLYLKAKDKEEEYGERTEPIPENSEGK